MGPAPQVGCSFQMNYPPILLFLPVRDTLCQNKGQCQGSIVGRTAVPLKGNTRQTVSRAPLYGLPLCPVLDRAWTELRAQDSLGIHVPHLSGGPKARDEAWDRHLRTQLIFSFYCHLVSTAAPPLPAVFGVLAPTTQDCSES